MNGSLRIVILSGPIGSGKTSLAEMLSHHYGAKIIKTRELILKQLVNKKQDRASLQKAGEKLDRVDNGAWLRARS